MTKILLPLLSIALLLNPVPVHPQEFKPMRPFLFAAAQGSSDEVDQFLKQGANIHTRNRFGFTALHLAASNNHAAVCTLLLENGAKLESRADDGRTPLNAASEKGSIETATLLLDRGANINAQFRGRMTSLNMALHRNFTDLALMLVQRGADVTLANEGKVAPMDVVLKRRFDHLFWPIFDASPIEPAERDTRLTVYLDIAVSLDNLNLFHTILEKAPKLSATDGVEIDLFFKAAECGSRTMLDYFIEHGRKLDEIIPGSQWSLLHLFTRENNLELMTYGLDKGIPIDSADIRQRTPLHVATRLGHIEAARLLLKAGASTDAQDESGSTPLHIAAAHGNTAMVRLLMAQGASPASVTNNGRTPLDTALFAGHVHMRKVFPLGSATIDLSDFEFTGDILELRQAVLNEESETLKNLLGKSGPDIDLPDEYGMTLLHYAADLGNADIINDLLSAHANVNTVNLNSGWTPLLHAVNGGHNNAAKLLMMAGADVNIQDARGWTALHIASFGGNDDLSEALRVAGARDDIKNHDDQLPRDLAGDREAFIQAQERQKPSR